MNEILDLCKGYKRLTYLEPLYELLEPFYHMELSTPLLCATPWKMVQEKKSSTAVLAIHGYQGYPGEMTYLGLKLYQANFDVYCVRLPGHGVTKEDFINTNFEDWLAVARSSLGYLVKEYKDVYVVGHSMGALIATIIAKEFKIERLALISPAFKMRGLSKAKIKILSFFKDELPLPWKSDPSFWGICERENSDDEILGKAYWSKIVLSQMFELIKLVEMAKTSLPKMYSKVICVFGSADFSVDSKWIEKYFKAKVSTPIEFLTIDGASHLCLYSNVKERRDLCNDSIVRSFID